MTEDEMIGWHHSFYRREFEQVLEVGNGQGNLNPPGSVHGVAKSWT